ncbi:type VI secretion system tube protein TssD [Aquimarina latercula]|uniref:type VI secretion system tube protein TssD n=1 Tax=Aquimarina latercula TaxID=987 RepID=UPI000413AE40|nr:type VI secretion system tube protein TssD [Aquimarina latercula]
MSFKVKLYVDSMEFNILQHHFGFLQNSDYTGRPISKPQSRTFDFIIEASKDNTFFEWATHPSLMKKECEIVFSPIQGNGKSTKIKLLDIYCVYCNYHFTSTGVDPFTVTFSLSPATILFDGQVIMSKHWKVTDPERLNVAPTTIESNKEITRYYLTNTDGNEIEEYQTGDIIYLNIETQNRIGDKTTVNFNDKEHDFKYNGTILNNDTIKDYVINSNQESIKLEVIDQQEA